MIYNHAVTSDDGENIAIHLTPVPVQRNGYSVRSVVVVLHRGAPSFVTIMGVDSQGEDVEEVVVINGANSDVLLGPVVTDQLVEDSVTMARNYVAKGNAGDGNG